MSTNSNAVSALNTLITRNYDAEKGYQQAAEQADNAELKNLFNHFAEQRYQFGHEIKDEIKKLGGDINKGTSLKGDLHRAWIDLRSTFASNDDVAVLDECIRGENVAADDYKEAINTEGLPISARETLQRQHSKIEAAIGTVENLKQKFQAIS